MLFTELVDQLAHRTKVRKVSKKIRVRVERSVSLVLVPGREEKREVCKHCGEEIQGSLKGRERFGSLCGYCYYDVEIRKKYEGEIGAEDGFFTAPLPGETTEARPGTEEKIRVMTRRAALRQQLFHPKDGWVEEEELD